MCNIQSPNTRALIIEVLENGKVSLPPVIHQPEHTLTIDELKKCRDYLDMIINNPDNFHIVKKTIPFTENTGACLMCMSEFDNDLQAQLGVCGKCLIAQPKKKIVIGESHSNCKSCDCDLLFRSMTERENGLCFKCEKEQILKASDYQPSVVSGKDVFPITAITQNDDKICDWPGCGKVLNKFARPNSWAKGHCLAHDSKKQPKLKQINPTDITKPGP